MKAELGQAQSVLRPSGAGMHPRQSQPRFPLSSPLPRRRPSPPRQAGHRPCPALHRLTGSHVSRRQGNCLVAKRAPERACVLPAPALASSSSPECGGSWCLGDGFPEAGLGGLSGGWRRDTGLSPLGRYQRSSHGATSVIRTWQQLATLLGNHTCPVRRQWNDANASGTF